MNKNGANSEKARIKRDNMSPRKPEQKTRIESTANKPEASVAGSASVMRQDSFAALSKQNSDSAKAPRVIPMTKQPAARHKATTVNNSSRVLRNITNAGVARRPKAKGCPTACLNQVGGAVSSDNSCAGCPGVDTYQDPMTALLGLLKDFDAVGFKALYLKSYCTSSYFKHHLISKVLSTTDDSSQLKHKNIGSQ